ncbi:hypothetical protein FIBSPDRAFT_796955, partial [Athelia psychrophila]
MTFPYPDTSYCSPPPEDKTNEPLCRPIPASSRFPALPAITATPAARTAPPGSVGWVTQKSASVQNRKASTRGTRGRGTPASLHIQPSRGGHAGAAKSASAVTSDTGSNSPWDQISRGPASAFPSSKQSASEKKNPWPRIPHFMSSSSETSTSTGESSVLTAPLPVFDLPAPPGISFNPMSWVDDVPSGLFPNVVVSNAQSTLPPLTSNAAAPQSIRHAKVNDGQYLEDAFEQLDVADPMEDLIPELSPSPRSHWIGLHPIDDFQHHDLRSKSLSVNSPETAIADIHTVPEEPPTPLSYWIDLHSIDDVEYLHDDLHSPSP